MKPNEKRLEAKKWAFLKLECLRLLDGGSARNLTACAVILGVIPATLYNLKGNDPIWAKALNLREQVIADELEERLEGITHASAQVTALIFRLKGIRPEKYRDNVAIKVDNPAFLELLKELREGKTEPIPEPPPNPNAEPLDFLANVLPKPKPSETQCLNY